MIEWEQALVDAMRKAAELAGWAEVARAASDEMDRNDSHQPKGSIAKC